MTDFWAGRRVLITGISGFVGSNLTRVLVDADADVVGLDLARTSPSLRVLGLNDVPVLVRDVREMDRVQWALEHGNGEAAWRPPEIVFHLAGISHPHQAQATPLIAWDVNIRGMWCVLEACRILPQIRAVVCASSDRVYGSLPKAHVPILADGSRAYAAVKQDSIRAAWLEEDSPMETEVYGTSKACGDLLVRAYGAMGVPIVALRHQNAVGSADPHRSHIVTGTICDLLDGKTPVIRGDGTTIKGYIAVESVCQAYLLLAEAVSTGRLAAGTAWNAAGVPISVLSLVQAIIQISGRDAVPEILREDLSQSGCVEILDDSRLCALGWTPLSLQEALRHTWQWYQERKGLAWLSP